MQQIWRRVEGREGFLYFHTNHNQLVCLFLVCFPQEETLHGGCLTMTGSSLLRHSAGCTWASSAHRRQSGCSMDQELNQGGLEGRRGAFGKIRALVSSWEQWEDMKSCFWLCFLAFLNFLSWIYGTHCPRFNSRINDRVSLAAKFFWV